MSNLTEESFNVSLEFLPNVSVIFSNITLRNISNQTSLPINSTNETNTTNPINTSMNASIITNATTNTTELSNTTDIPPGIESISPPEGYYWLWENQKESRLVVGDRLIQTYSMTTNVTNYYFSDETNSIVLVLDKNGNTIFNKTYDAFGSTLTQDAAFNPSIQFASKQIDGSGLYDFGARKYDTLMGRFTTPDKAPGDINNPLSLNRYLFVLNNPLRYTDKDGNIVSTMSGFDTFLKNTPGAAKAYNDVFISESGPYHNQFEQMKNDEKLMVKFNYEKSKSSVWKSLAGGLKDVGSGETRKQAGTLLISNQALELIRNTDPNVEKGILIMVNEILDIIKNPQTGTYYADKNLRASESYMYGHYVRLFTDEFSTGLLIYEGKYNVEDSSGLVEDIVAGQMAISAMRQMLANSQAGSAQAHNLEMQILIEQAYVNNMILDAIDLGMIQDSTTGAMDKAVSATGANSYVETYNTDAETDPNALWQIGD
jgi:RHS repeat-associated protein